MVDANFWVIAMWLAVYRADFLEKLLTLTPQVASLRGLNQVEVYYKDRLNWQRALSQFSGKIGFINLQFGGLEMHRNQNWRDLIQLPNVAVR
jgi:hypothetical protein